MSHALWSTKPPFSETLFDEKGQYVSGNTNPAEKIYFKIGDGTWQRYVEGAKVPDGAQWMVTDRAASDFAPSVEDEKASLKGSLALIDDTLNAQRWAREGILGLGDLIDILRNVPSSVTTVSDLIAYLQAIPAPGTGMQKLKVIETQAAGLRSQLSTLPPA